MRFLGRRVYLSLAVALVALVASSVSNDTALAGPLRFMPPVAPADLPSGLLARFAGAAPHALVHWLAFLLPLSTSP